LEKEGERCQEEMEQGPLRGVAQEQEEAWVKEVGVLEGWVVIDQALAPEESASAPIAVP